MSVIEDLQQRLVLEKEIVFSVKVRPNAAKTDIKSLMDDGTIKMNVAAVPEDGKANKAIVRFFAKSFDVPSRNIEILLGQMSALKRIKIIL